MQTIDSHQQCFHHVTEHFPCNQHQKCWIEIFTRIRVEMKGKKKKLMFSTDQTKSVEENTTVKKE